MPRVRIIVLILIVSSNYSLTQERQDGNATIIPKGQSRSFILTNYVATFFFSETGSANTASLHGLNVQTEEFLEDYIIEINGKALKREEADAYLYANKLIRKYSHLELEEEISLLDSLPVLVIKLKSEKKLPVSVVPCISGASRSNNYITYWAEEDKLLYIAKKTHLVQNETENFPVWTGVFTNPASQFMASDSDLNQSYVGFIEKEGFFPGKLNFLLDGTAYIFFIVGDDKNDVLQKRKQALSVFNIYLEESSKKIEGIRRT